MPDGGRLPAGSFVAVTTVVYTDGACRGNPGPGGWAWAVDGGPFASGADPHTTNQRMEIQAAYEAVKSLSGTLEVVSDSTYVVNCFRDRWWEGWLAKGWRNSQRKPVANRDLWEPFVELVRRAGRRHLPLGQGPRRRPDERPRRPPGRRGGGQPGAPVRATGAPRGSGRPTCRGSAGTGTAVGRPSRASTATAWWCSAIAPPISGATTTTRRRTPCGRAWPTSSGQGRRSSPSLVVVSGLRLGAETLAAEAALEVGVPLAAVLAYPEPQSVWPAASQRPVRGPGGAGRAGRGAAGPRSVVQAAGGAPRWRAVTPGWPGTRPRRCWCGTVATRRSASCSAPSRIAWATTCGCSTRPSWCDVRLASDTGGTFTDLVAADGTIAKVPSTPDDPARALRAGVAQLAGDRLGELSTGGVLAHGTTVGTNALLERRGATVALVTNEGFADLIEIGRQDRPSLYDQAADRPDPLVERRHRYEVRGRLDATGRRDRAARPRDARGDRRRDRGRGGRRRRRRRAAARRPRARPRAAGDGRARRPRSRRHRVARQVSPEFREYERTVTTVVNAYLRPACRAYLRGLTELAAEVFVMTSAGGLVPAEVGSRAAGRAAC